MKKLLILILIFTGASAQGAVRVRTGAAVRSARPPVSSRLLLTAGSPLLSGETRVCSDF